MTIYSGSIARAQASIAKKGAVCKWRRYVKQDGAEPWLEDESVSPQFEEWNVPVVVLPYDGSVKNMSFAQIEGDVTTFQSYGLMGQTTEFVPQLNDVLIRPDGQELSVKALDELKPATETILWTIGLVA